VRSEHVPDGQCGDVVADGQRRGQGGEQVGGVVVGQGAAVVGALQEVGVELFGPRGQCVGVGAAQSGGVAGGVGELPAGSGCPVWAGSMARAMSWRLGSTLRPIIAAAAATGLQPPTATTG